MIYLENVQFSKEFILYYTFPSKICYLCLHRIVPGIFHKFLGDSWFRRPSSQVGKLPAVTLLNAKGTITSIFLLTYQCVRSLYNINKFEGSLIWKFFLNKYCNKTKHFALICGIVILQNRYSRKRQICGILEAGNFRNLLMQPILILVHSIMRMFKSFNYSTQKFIYSLSKTQQKIGLYGVVSTW